MTKKKGMKPLKLVSSVALIASIAYIIINDRKKNN